MKVEEVIGMLKAQEEHMKGHVENEEKKCHSPGRRQKCQGVQLMWTKVTTNYNIYILTNLD